MTTLMRTYLLFLKMKKMTCLILKHQMIGQTWRPASSHPMYFARKIAEVVSNANLDWMDQPSASIVVQVVLRPAFLEEHSFIKNHLSVGRTSNDEVNHLGKVVEEHKRGTG